MERQGQGAYPYARIFAILQISHELLTLGVTASQRDIFYRQVPTSQVLCPCAMHNVPIHNRQPGPCMYLVPTSLHMLCIMVVQLCVPYRWFT